MKLVMQLLDESTVQSHITLGNHHRGEAESMGAMVTSATPWRSSRHVI